MPGLDVLGVPHAPRDATVSGALGTVPGGRTDRPADGRTVVAVVAVAPHDPLPLLRQIEDRRPGVFAVEYRQRGPEAWRLLLTRR